jgi:hypothetical protein
MNTNSTEINERDINTVKDVVKIQPNGGASEELKKGLIHLSCKYY